MRHTTRLLFALLALPAGFLHTAVGQDLPVDSVYARAVAADLAGDAALALDLYTEVVARDSTHADAYWNRAGLFGQQQRYGLAVADLARVQRFVPWHAPSFGNQGWFLILDGRVEDARAPTRRAMALDTLVYSWPLNLGHTHLLTGRIDSARVYYTQAVRRMASPNDLDGALGDFDLFVELGWAADSSRAMRVWMAEGFAAWEADVLAPRREADSLQAAGDEHLWQGAYPEAAEAYAGAAEAEQRSRQPRPGIRREAWTRAGMALFMSQRYDEALDALGRALALAEEEGDAAEAATVLSWIGGVYRDSQRHEEAVAAYERALALLDETGPEVDVAVVLDMLGTAYVMGGRIEDALDSYARALDIHERLEDTAEQARVLRFIALVHESQNRPEAAIDAYTRALSLLDEAGQEADVASVAGALGLLYFTVGRPDAAIASYARALEIHERLDTEVDLAVLLRNMGPAYEARGRYEDALDVYNRALALFEQTGREEEAITIRGHLGEVYRAWGRYEEAITYHRQDLEARQRIGDEEGIARAMNNLGLTYAHLNRYEEATAAYEQFLTFVEATGREEGVATVLNNIASVYADWGRYDEALVRFERALEIDERLGRSAGVVTRLNNIGDVYEHWGRYDEAVTYFERALETAEAAGLEVETSVVLNNIGVVYGSWGRYDEALVFYQRAMEIDERIGREAGLATNLNNIGLAYKQLGRYDEALAHYQRSMEINRRLGRASYESTDLNNIGLLYADRGRYDEALVHFTRALEIDERLGLRASAATVLYNIGTTYHRQNQNLQAVDALSRSVGLLEELRLTAEGEVRRDYLDSQVGAYRYLISAYLRAGRTEQALRAIEQSRARLLAEQLTPGDSVLPGPSLAAVQQMLDGETAVLVYANSGTVFSITGLVLTRDSLFGVELADGTLIHYVDTTYGDAYRALMSEQHRRRVDRRAAAGQEAGALVEGSDFEAVVQYYRRLLTSAKTPTRGVRAVDEAEQGVRRDDLGRRFHELLIEPLQPYLEGKTTLLVIPDEALGLLPFEALIDGEGRYLAERYRVRYVQSLQVLDLLSRRRYRETRRPLLAFGGAVYDTTARAEARIESDAPLEAVQQAARTSIDRGGDQQASYAALGYGAWSDLPGARGEVEALGELIEGAEVITGAGVTEGRVKRMSDEGVLDDYAVVHFATHGLVVPEVPELSALVLSQGVDAAEDGYLRMQEIAELRLRADFVNLSACETGLGRVYGGEGVVGLAQAFVLAGANGLSVSLWQVSDRSTRVFMEEVYRLAARERVPYPEAIATVKRGFIEGTYGEAWRAPYYWAPFVYYGK